MSEPTNPKVSTKATETVPLTGHQYELAAGDYRATVTQLGGCLRELTYRDQPLIAGYPQDQLPPAGHGQLLAPWPNRIDGGRYRFDGASYQLELSEVARGNAIHGLTRWADWEPADAAPDRVTLTHLLLGRPGYPFCLRLSAGYRLDPATGLEVDVTARNVGTKAAPYGTGSHPYLTAGATPVIDGCELQIQATRWLPADDRGIPSAAPQDVTGSRFDFRARHLIADTSLDHALTGLARDADGRAWARLTSGGFGVALWAGLGYDWLQVFTGDALAPELARRALAVEPMTCPPNAFVTGKDLLSLAPGTAVTHRWGISVD